MLAILPIHIAAGTLSVLSGAAALVLRKGGPTHRRTGFVFVVAMTVMGVTAAVLGNNVGNLVAGGLTIYMISTGWMTARRRDKRAGMVEIAAFIVAMACALAGFYSTYLYATGAKTPENPFIIFANLLVSSAIALAALGDLSVVLRRGISGAQRIARHLWRMCFGLLIAVGSFAAQGVSALPSAIPAPALLLASMLLVFAVMAFWLVRVLFTRWYSEGRIKRGKAKEA